MKRWTKPVGSAILTLFLLLLWIGTTGAKSQFPLTVTDDSGRRVTFDRAAERIVSLVPSHTEILFALGAQDQIAGLDEYSDWPQEALAKPRVGNLNGINYELVLALEADLVIGLSAHKDQGLVEKLEDLGIPVLILEPQSLAETYDTIEVLGCVTGLEAQAVQLITDIESDVEQVVARLESRLPRRVFYEVWHDPLMTAGPGSFIHELMQLAGGENIAGDAGNPWPMFSLESLLARDPEVIITPFAESVNALAEGTRPEWAGILAVRQGRFYVIDPNIISRQGPRVAEGLRALAKAIHPEAFAGDE